ncbi:MAG: hypothetical protein AAF434_12365 [Pseudomonadota bacterium]
MNNEQFLSALRKALRGLDKAAVDEILREIQSHADEAGNDDTLIAHFGDPHVLAQQYLDGVEVPPSVGSRAARFGKVTLAGIGGVVVVLIAVIALFFTFYNGDEFDYADEQSAGLTDDERNWQSVPWREPLNLKVNQAEAIFYWHSHNELKWDCEGADQFRPETQNVLEIRHGRCIVFLPSTQSDFEIHQASVVMIRPQASTNLNVTQANVRIAENGERYQYDMNLNRSNRGSFKSHENADKVIAVVAFESNIEPYSYE